MINNPVAVKDIKSYLLYEYKNKENKYAVGSIKEDRFIEVDESEYKWVMSAISMMNGIQTIEEIQKKLLAKGISMDVKMLCDILERANLLQNANQQKVEKSEFDRLSLNLIKLNISKLNFLMQPLIKGVNFFIFFFVILMAVSLVGIIFNMKISHAISGVNLFAFSDKHVYRILVMFIIMLISLFIHELSHGVMAVKCGLVPKELCISLYLYISPIIYLKIPGIYTVPPKKRISIWISGVMSNALLACIGLVSYIISISYGFSEYNVIFFSYLFYINLTLIIVNLCPLLPLDGYFILATFLKIPNLRKQSFIAIKKSWREKKIQVKGVYVVYFILSITAMLGIVMNELMSAITLFSSAYTKSKSVITALWSVKQYILLLLVVLVVRIRGFLMKKKKKTNQIQGISGNKSVKGGGLVG